jgi:hypothetical protein
VNKNVAFFASKVGFDAARYTWFDLTNIPAGSEDEFNEYSRAIGWGEKKIPLNEMPMPADDVAIIFDHGGRDIQFIITFSKECTIEGELDSVYVGPAICAYYAHAPDPIPAAIIVNSTNSYTNSWLHLRSDYRESLMKRDFQTLAKFHEENLMLKPVMTLALLNRKATVLETTLEAYKGIDKSPFINQKRRAKNKPPIYEWITIELKPGQVRKEHQGGTHASPARHQRRGHYRKLPSGKLAWVKPTWVGNIERGLIIHDYVSKELQ